VEGYDAGAELLYQFFQRELPQYLEPDLDPMGRHIIKCCLDNGTLGDLESLLPQDVFVEEHRLPLRRR
jgi:hypothetical protein